MSSPTLRALAIAAAALSAGVVLRAAAQTADPPTGAWRRAIDAAWQRSVLAAEAGGQRRSALAERTAASSTWAGSPSFEFDQLRKRQAGTGSRETEVGIALPLWLPGQRDARLAAADAQAAAAAAATDAARLQLARSVVDAAAAVWAQRAEAEAAEVQARELDALAQDVARRVKAGDLARADALAADAEQLASQDALSRATLQRQNAEARWTALTGLATLPPPPPPQEPPPARLHATHPLLQEATARLALAHKRLDAVRLSRRDAPELVVRAHQEVGGGEPDTRGIGVALRIPLATAGRNEALLGAALAEVELAEAHEAGLRRELELEQAAAEREAEASRRQAGHEATRARLLRERAALIQKSFDAGQTPLPETLRALSQAAQAEAASRRQAVAAALAALRVELARGLMP
ncbi:TolC family protein [Rubrivivax gelatinosus]|uniref:Outer membrane efflux protein n=1 Tax=Rubrivivax gelatinosus (strain NBRC 100245 / IL144) TaxID=983917 RepID=I0HTG0_RUBGI|nr:TolC family protein [Rubrivivax gelatinosus]BAL96297.1 outer membrane efflux protein [Rubrivivax gelatinosus IL144]